jgi:hypothetical protein
MPYKSEKYGRANRAAWMQIPSADYAAIPQGADTADWCMEYFANLVYLVNASDISISGGDISVDLTSTNEILSAISGDTSTLVTQTDEIEGLLSAGNDYLASLSACCDELAEFQGNYSTIIRVSALAPGASPPTHTYIMKADPGSISGDPVWQIKRIYESGDDVNIEWADGDAEFDNAASGYLSLSYSL